ncbi:MAG: DUF4386 domain-containing protein [Anaerolineae bacterium]|jgi:hypothetical protein
MKAARQQPTLHRPATYEIKVPGHIGEQWSDWAGGMTIAVEGEAPPVTTLTGLRLVAGSALQYQLAVAIDFLAMVAVMALVFSLFTILRPASPYLALLALGWRIGEVILQAGGKVPDYLLLTLSQSAASSPGGGTAELVSLGQILIAGSTRALWLSFVFLSIGSVLNNWLFYRSRLIPAALAIFGLASTALYTLGSVLALVIELPESATQGMMLPLVLLELSLGFYLAIFGIRQQAPQRGAAALAGS